MDSRGQNSNIKKNTANFFLENPILKNDVFGSDLTSPMF
jgi:hypothetical protein